LQSRPVSDTRQRSCRSRLNFTLGWFVAGSIIGFRWLSGFNFPMVLGIGLLMAVMNVLIG